MQLPNGFFWGPKLKTPPQPSLGLIETLPTFNGIYDIATIPVGDNWAYNHDIQNFTSVNIENSCISIIPKFDIDEPSCGFLILIRKLGESWKLVAGQDNGAVFGSVSTPIYSHSGSRVHIHKNNGYVIGPHKVGFHDNFGGNPVGPLSFIGERIPIGQSSAPDISFVYGLDKGKIYIALSGVDMFGRETELSPTLEVNIPENGSRITIRRNFAPQMGLCGVYLYAGTSPTDLHRQPVLSCVGKELKYLWPVNKEQYTLNMFRSTNIRHVTPPSYGVASIINWPQKQVVDGKKFITYDKSSYNLYCPFLLPYDPNNFGRVIGGEMEQCIFNHVDMYGLAKLVTDFPLVYIQNQKDKVRNANFITRTAPVGLAFSDYSGGQAFSNSIDNCGFGIYSEDGIGILVADDSSQWVGQHTASELRLTRTGFWATIPVHIEGNQSCQIKFLNMCTLWGMGNTDYRGDTAIIYAATPNDIDFILLEGIGGSFRSIVCLSCDTGQPHITLDDIFIDAGCPVYVTVSGKTGGKITIKNGDTINSHSQTWARLIEAPVSIQTKLRVRDIKMPKATSISYMLNQLAIDSDREVGQIISPSIDLWLNKGLQLEYPAPNATSNPAYFDFRKKQTMDWHFGFSDMADTLEHKTQVDISPVGEL